MSKVATSSWQRALSEVVTDPKELLSLLQLDSALLDAANKAAKAFPLRVPRSYLSRIKPNDLQDPLLKQILPLGAELIDMQGYEKDALRESDNNPVPGLLHKYRNRVLVTLTGVCAIHCRYCFRRHFPYADNNPGRLGWEKIIAYINDNPAVEEVILSGGDPLAISDTLLAAFGERLKTIPHLKRLRIHTRLPIVLPQRVTTSLTEWFSQLPWQVVMVIHANHAQEINAEVDDALKLLKNARVTLLNQAVLLRGVNDDVATLAALSTRLFEVGVLPYYLHVLDKVAGAAHFDLPLAEAKALHASLNTKLSGYLVPRLVCETPGAASKTWLSTELFTE